MLVGHIKRRPTSVPTNEEHNADKRQDSRDESWPSGERDEHDEADEDVKPNKEEPDRHATRDCFGLAPRTGPDEVFAFSQGDRGHDGDAVYAKTNLRGRGSSWVRLRVLKQKTQLTLQIRQWK